MSDVLATSHVVRAIGWALLESLWQATGIALLAALILLALRRSASTYRYAVSCLALAAMCALPVLSAATHLDERRLPHPRAIGPGRSPAAHADARATSALPPRASQDTRPRPLSPELARDRWPEERLAAWSIAAVPLWLIGVLALSIRLVGGWIGVCRIRRGRAKPISEEWQARCGIVARRLRVSRPVRFVESAAVNVPMVIGWLRPVILLPASAITGLSPSQLEAIVAHELAHVRRHDYLVNIVQTAAETLLFYHPAAWWISRQIRREREHCCDDEVVALFGDPVTYAGALADLEALRQTDITFALAANGGALLPRIRRLLAQPPARRDQSSAWFVVTAVTVLALVLMGQDVRSVSRTVADDGVIQGRVVDARSRGPIAGATVELSNGGRVVMATTDAEGRFEARGLQQGEWHAYVQAPGYVPTQYGQRNAAEMGNGLEVRSAQITRGADVALEPAGGLSGRVFTDAGQGLGGVQVELLAERYLPEGPALRPVAFAQTEDLGRFRFGDLMPGPYVVRAYLDRPVAPSHAGSGVYAATYFPGTSRAEDALPMTVSAGQELLDVDFRLSTVTTRQVSGRVEDPTGAPVDQAKVMLMGAVNGMRGFEQTSPVSAEGTFRFQGVMPGEYMISVVEGIRTMRWMGATRPLMVDEDVPGVVLTARLGARLEGRIGRDEGAALPFDPRSLSISFEQRTPRAAGTGEVFHAFGTGPDAIRRDGTFSIESPSGPSTVRLTRLPENWTIKAIRFNGSDIADRPVDFSGGQPIGRLDIVLTDRLSDIEGVVTDRNNRIVTNCTVVVFPEDRERWNSHSRLVRTARSLQSGRYQIDGLPPADYLAVALETIPQDAWNDPQVLDRLWPLATRFHLREGEQRAVDLKLSRAPSGLLSER
jgi:beta-lactamase regulating signal transducer with metallopeptidase domain